MPSPILLLHWLDAVFDPLHLFERKDFGDDLALDESEGNRAVFARVAGFGQVVADDPTVPFGNLKSPPRGNGQKEFPPASLQSDFLPGGGGGVGKVCFYLNHAPVLVTGALVVLFHPGTGCGASEHEIAFHAHDPLHGAVAAVLGHRVLDVDDVADAHAPPAPVPFGHHDAVAAHGQRGHHGRAQGAVDGEDVRADEMHAGHHFDRFQHGEGEVAQGRREVEAHRGLGADGIGGVGHGWLFGYDGLRKDGWWRV